MLLRAYVGGALQSELVDLDDDELERLVLGELSGLLAIRGAPQMSCVVRQRQAMPQYYVGHESLVERISQRVAALENLAMAGNALHGIGIPNCIHTGEQAAERLVGSLAENRKRGRKTEERLGRNRSNPAWSPLDHAGK